MAWEHYASTLKAKDMVPIPWMVAMALQADGWYLRSEIIWAKPNPMPESVTDRPTKAHEQVFLLAKAERYFFDAEAVKEPATYPDGMNGNSPVHSPYGQGFAAGRSNGSTTTGRNKRSVWTIPSAPFSEAHFATFPPALVEPCVQAGTSARGACPACGAPWARKGDKILQSVIGDAVRHAREQAGLSREALAARLGIYVGNIWNWEVGGCLPCAAKWDDLMAALGLTFSREAFIERAEYLVTGRQAGPKQQAAADDPFVNRPYAERMVRLPRAVAEWAPTCACGPGLAPGVVEPCVQAGTSERGCCAKCGAPWRRDSVTELVILANRRGTRKALQPGADMADVNSRNVMGYNRTTTLGWAPSCACAPNPVPCVVLDPFAGAGTVGLVADRLGRDAILIELKPEYAAMAERRIREEAPLLTAVEIEAAAPPANGNGHGSVAPEQLALLE
jgi:transcriptional regulator with XRE-family HTH domain